MTQCEVAVHLREHFRHLAERAEIEMVERGEYLSIRGGEGFNYILGVGEVPSREDRQALCAGVGASVWFSSPYDEGLAAALEAEGWVHGAPLTGVSCDLREWKGESCVAEVVPVKSEADYVEWCAIFSSTWGRQLELAVRFFRGLQEDGGLFVAKVDGQVVGSSALGIQEDVAGCYWGCVLPEYRRRGIGSHMGSECLKFAKEQKCRKVVAHCLSTSLGIYRRLGFKETCEMALFQRS